jgi:hypothetical protein
MAEPAAIEAALAATAERPLLHAATGQPEAMAARKKAGAPSRSGHELDELGN